MVRSAPVRKLITSLGTTLVIFVSLLTNDSLHLNGLPRILVGVTGATMLYTSVSLALAIHRSFPTRHDNPEDLDKLFEEGPYELCRHPFYFLIIITHISISLILSSIIGLFATIILIPGWLFLIKIEERELIAYWGEKYLNYMKRVPALVPDLKISSKQKHYPEID
ncbi:MAG: hypothetical protein GSR79_05395 [Desulfurococcales archaeon]|nr:hypothetical protein [Desulfurococcales archaeon]